MSHRNSTFPISKGSITTGTSSSQQAFAQWDGDVFQFSIEDGSKPTYARFVNARGGKLHLDLVGDVTINGSAITMGAAGIIQGSDETYDLRPVLQGAITGNKRGENSVDLQTSRNLGSQVASGNNSGIFGGSENTSSGVGSFVGGGVGNTASNDYSTVLGGGDNASSGLESFTGGGSSNTSSGSRSCVLGGSALTASAVCSGCFAGDSNEASATCSGCFAGDSNVASGDYSGCFAGENNVSSGLWSCVLGSSGNTVSGDGSAALASETVSIAGDSCAAIATKACNINATSLYCTLISSYSTDDTLFDGAQYGTIISNGKNNAAICQGDYQVAIGKNAHCSTSSSAVVINASASVNQAPYDNELILQGGAVTIGTSATQFIRCANGGLIYATTNFNAAAATLSALPDAVDVFTADITTPTSTQYGTYLTTNGMSMRQLWCNNSGSARVITADISGATTHIWLFGNKAAAGTGGLTYSLAAYSTIGVVIYRVNIDRFYIFLNIT